MNLFKDKVVLITGAASGIGQATALAFAKEGAHIALCDIQENKGIETAKLVEKLGGTSMYIHCNISEEEHVKSMIDTVIDKWGRIDCAFNNAGIEGTPRPSHECTLQDWNKILDVNLKGTWLCMKHEIKAMLENSGGTIVNCSSIAGLVGFVDLAPYTASKHGVIGLTKTAALEYAKKNIRINAVCPGPIDTPMLERFTHNDNTEFETTDPMGRVGQPEEIAEAVLWLSSPRSSYVTGQALAIDGGWITQ